MKILLAIDNSMPSAAAVSAVLARPWPKGSVIRVMSCATPIPPSGAPDAAISLAHYASIAYRDALSNAREISHSVSDELNLHGIRAHAVFREGDPATTIVEEAELWSADLIIVGTHDYKGFKNLFHGSVARSVVKHSPCSVEVVKRPETVKVDRGRAIPIQRSSQMESRSIAA